ncbi:centrosomin isoform X3 [Nilaparvata lugens]|uniref:centrosomin isoform X3 n=1 Tax=Nilaparvata lugens TaxID=108931 RepID=UPI00193D18F6|nr:centrosomin isoform X3 [Nilaparvata lugens]
MVFTFYASPKCTSPPGGDKMVSPGRVRTMKEYEEQMAELKKENFNLKLRIYFIEERQEQMKGMKDVDELFKKNVELSCELETLKRDLSEREELLLQSAKAVEVLQNQHKKQLEDLKISTAKDKAYLEEHIVSLQKALHEKDETFNQFEDSTAMYALAFGFNSRQDQRPNKTLAIQEEMNAMLLKMSEYENELQGEKHDYRMLEEEFERAKEESCRLSSQVSALEEELEKRDGQLQQALFNLESKSEQLDALSQKLARKDKTKNEELTEKTHRIKELENKISELERKVHLNLSGSRSSLESSNGSNSSRETSSKSRLRKSEERSLEKQLQETRCKQQNLEQQMNLRLQDMQRVCERKEKTIEELQASYTKACVTLQSLMKKCKLKEKEVDTLRAELSKKDRMLEKHNLEASRSLSSSANTASLEKFDEDSNIQFGCSEQELRELYTTHQKVIQDMESQFQSIRLSLEEKEAKLRDMEEKVISLARTDIKDNRIAELEGKLVEMKIKFDNIEFNEESNKENIESKATMTRELECKMKENEHLQKELSKRNYNLQELINKELWDKNKEIEKLNKICDRRQMEILQLQRLVAERQSALSFEASKDLKCVEMARDKTSPNKFTPSEMKTLHDQLLKSLEEKKLLNRKVEELEQQLHNMPERDNDSPLVQKLKNDLMKARADVETADRSRKEVVSACSLLTNRLKELADFLDSLLPSLGAKKRRVVQHAVERSRELSRSFSAAADDSSCWQNLQPSLYVPLLPDFSTVDFWSGDDMADPTLEEEVTDDHHMIAQLRTQIETLTEQVKQKDITLEKMHSQVLQPDSLGSLNVWSLGQSTIDNCEADENNIMHLVDMLENLDRNSNSTTAAFDRNGNISMKSSNIGEITITSRKVAPRENAEKQLPTTGNVSESEAWSEPDRSVSLARMGLGDETPLMVQSWPCDDSSDTTDNAHKSLINGKRTKYGATEVRRLQNRIRTLESENEALRGELNILHQITPQDLAVGNVQQLEESVTREDKATSISELAVEAVKAIPSSLLNDIRLQREKLESILHHNDNLRRQLEDVYSSYKVDDDCNNLLNNNQCERLTFPQDLDSLEMKDREIESLKKEKFDCVKQIEQLREQLMKKELELNDCQSTLLGYKKSLEEEKSRLEEELSKNQMELQTVEAELSALKKKCSDCSEEKSVLCQQLDVHKSINERNRSELDDLNRRLKACEQAEQKTRTESEEWRKKLEECQSEVEEVRTRLSEVEGERRRLEKASSDLEQGFRQQLDAATKQCQQAEARLKEMENKHKQRETEAAEREAEWRRQVDSATLTTSQVVLERTRLANDKLRLQQEIRRCRDSTHLERVKSELERRVAELEAANMELETRLTKLHVKKVQSDSENDDGASVPSSVPSVAASGSKQAWAPYSCPSSPLSPTHPPLSPTHQPLSPHLGRYRYSSQRSNDISSDYMSDFDNYQPNAGSWPQRPLTSTSPDLGIESDQGRHSSLEVNAHAVTRTSKEQNEFARLQEENVDLRKQLHHTKHALQDTLSQLTVANRKKRQVEKAICQQIGKTHLILKEARVNLESDADYSC